MAELDKVRLIQESKPASKILTDFNGYSLSETNTLSLGGAYRIYLGDNDSFDIKNQDTKKPITRVVAIQILADTKFATIKDNDHQDQKVFFTAQNSQSVLGNIEEFPIGFVLYGDFQEIEVEEGAVVLFCL